MDTIAIVPDNLHWTWKYPRIALAVCWLRWLVAVPLIPFVLLSCLIVMLWGIVYPAASPWAVERCMVNYLSSAAKKRRPARLFLYRLKNCQGEEQ